MSVTKLPSGRWRAQVHVPRQGNVAVGRILDGPSTFTTKAEAKAARARARERILAQRPEAITLAQFADLWTTDPLYARPKESTNLHNAERIRAFVKANGHLPLAAVDDLVVARWLAGGRHKSTVPALRAMFTDAASAKAGRLIDRNPFAGLGLSKPRGNRDKVPPNQQDVETLIALARDLTPPSFTAWLQFACLVGIRPSEIDALQWTNVDLDAGEVHIVRQWNPKVAKFTDPKHGPYTAALSGRARQVLEQMKRDHGDSPFVFVTLRGHHYTPSTRTHHWNRVRVAAGMPNVSLYMATRHAWASYALNTLGLAPHVIAHQLGHKDGGKLVVQLYGHPDARVARSQIRDAFDGAGTVRPLRVERKDSA